MAALAPPSGPSKQSSLNRVHLPTREHLYLISLVLLPSVCAGEEPMPPDKAVPSSRWGAGDLHGCHRAEENDPGSVWNRDHFPSSRRAHHIRVWSVGTGLRCDCASTCPNGVPDSSINFYDPVRSLIRVLQGKSTAGSGNRQVVGTAPGVFATSGGLIVFPITISRLADVTAPKTWANYRTVWGICSRPSPLLFPSCGPSDCRDLVGFAGATP